MKFIRRIIRNEDGGAEDLPGYTLLTLIAIGSLVFIRWGSFSIFVEGVEGFIGDKDLLLAAVGILFFSLGGGKAGGTFPARGPVPPGALTIRSGVRLSPDRRAVPAAPAAPRGCHPAGRG